MPGNGAGLPRRLSPARAFRPDLQNGFFGALHSFWTGAGFVEGIRSLLYFDRAAGYAGHVVTLFAWFAAGLAVLLAVAERRQTDMALAPVPQQEQAEIEELEEAVAV